MGDTERRSRVVADGGAGGQGGGQTFPFEKMEKMYDGDGTRMVNVAQCL